MIYDDLWWSYLVQLISNNQLMKQILQDSDTVYNYPPAIKRGLLENNPLASMIFPAINQILIAVFDYQRVNLRVSWNGGTPQISPNHPSHGWPF